VTEQPSAEAIVAQPVTEHATGDGPTSVTPGEVAILSTAALNPTGGAVRGRDVGQPAVEANLMARVLTPENLRRAWKRVKAHRGAPGVEGITGPQVPAVAREHGPAIRAALAAGP
jgi:RNA-directed DNA polymerase